MNYQSFWKKYQWYIIFGGMICYGIFLREDRPFVQVKDLDLFILIGGLVYFAGKSEIDRMMANSPHLITNRIISSIGSQPLTFVDSNVEYNFFRLGGYNSTIAGQGFHEPGRAGVMIAPKNLTKRYNQSYAIDGLVEEVDLDSLPLEAKRLIETLNLRGPFYDASIPLYVEDCKFNPLTLILAQRNTINEQNEIINSKFQSVKQVTSLASNISNSFKTDSNKMKIPFISQLEK